MTDAVSGNVVKGEDREKFEGLLIRALLGQEVDFPALISRQRIRRAYESLEGERIPTRIEFDNDTSPDRTVMDIETEDRLGLLYTVSTVLSDLYLNISLAKICTEKGAAIDSFYIGEADGQKIASGELQQEIESRIRAAIDAIPPALTTGTACCRECERTTALVRFL